MYQNIYKTFFIGIFDDENYDTFLIYYLFSGHLTK